MSVKKMGQPKVRKWKLPFYIFYYMLINLQEEGMCATVCMHRLKDNPWGQHFFHHEGHRDQPQMARVDSVHLAYWAILLAQELIFQILLSQLNGNDVADT